MPKVNLANYSSHIYANLPDFFQAKEMLLHCDHQIIKLGLIITKYALQQHLGVALLHKHFNLYENEKLVRTVKDNEMMVECLSSDSSKYTGYMWGFAKIQSNSPYELYPLEFYNDLNIPYWILEANKIVEEEHAFREEFFENLSNMGLCGYFGLCLIPNKLFKLSKGETLMETDMPLQRRLIIRMLPNKQLNEMESTQTLWVF